MTHEPFTTDEIRAAEIEAAREEGRLAGLMEALTIARYCWEKMMGSSNVGMMNAAYGAQLCASAIEAKAKEAGR